MSFTFNKLGKMGRLGNQIFQIAATIGISLKNGRYCGFPEWEYDKYFINRLPIQRKSNLEVNEKNFHFDEYVLQSNLTYNLHGYFQSWKYFESYKREIKEQFTFTDSFKKETINKFNHFDKKTIAIHVRRGDYVDHTGHYNLTINYYLSAIENIYNWKDCNLLFFSDDQEFCKWHFSCLPNAYFSPCNEIEDLCLMTVCDHFIIANSSLSWWGAYLGKKTYSIVIRPKNHFHGTLAKHDIKDLYPVEWLVMDDKKPDLKDVTFVIPVKYDHNDRMANLNLAVQHLQSNFETNIHVIEQGGNKFLYTRDFAKYVTFDTPYFHRTKMINIIASMFSKTEFVVNFDADVILNPVQIWYSVQKLRDGLDIVYPYDGTFNHVDRVFMQKLQKNHYPLIKMNFRTAKESYGGAVFMNRKSFLNAGGENEKFISFGPEDAERYNRFLKLNLNVIRINGGIYHLDHYRGLDSSKKNPFIEANRKEWHKVKDMNPDELKKYIKTWPWANKI